MATTDAKTSPVLTQSQHVRLELLQLAYRHDRGPDDIVDRARKLEEYVNEKAGRKRPEDREADADGPI